MARPTPLRKLLAVALSVSLLPWQTPALLFAQEAAPSAAEQALDQAEADLAAQVPARAKPDSIAAIKRRFDEISTPELKDEASIFARLAGIKLEIDAISASSEKLAKPPALAPDQARAALADIDARWERVDAQFQELSKAQPPSRSDEAAAEQAAGRVLAVLEALTDQKSSALALKSQAQAAQGLSSDGDLRAIDNALGDDAGRFRSALANLKPGDNADQILAQFFDQAQGNRRQIPDDLRAKMKAALQERLAQLPAVRPQVAAAVTMPPATGLKVSALPNPVRGNELQPGARSWAHSSQSLSDWLGASGRALGDWVAGGKQLAGPAASAVAHLFDGVPNAGDNSAELARKLLSLGLTPPAGSDTQSGAERLAGLVQEISGSHARIAVNEATEYLPAKIKELRGRIDAASRRSELQALSKEVDRWCLRFHGRGFYSNNTPDDFADDCDDLSNRIRDRLKSASKNQAIESLLNEGKSLMGVPVYGGPQDALEDRTPHYTRTVKGRETPKDWLLADWLRDVADFDQRFNAALASNAFAFPDDADYYRGEKAKLDQRKSPVEGMCFQGDFNLAGGLIRLLLDEAPSVSAAARPAEKGSAQDEFDRKAADFKRRWGELVRDTLGPAGWPALSTAWTQALADGVVYAPAQQEHDKAAALVALLQALSDQGADPSQLSADGLAKLLASKPDEIVKSLDEQKKQAQVAAFKGRFVGIAFRIQSLLNEAVALSPDRRPAENDPARADFDRRVDDFERRWDELTNDVLGSSPDAWPALSKSWSDAVKNGMSDDDAQKAHDKTAGLAALVESMRKWGIVPTQVSRQFLSQLAGDDGQLGMVGKAMAASVDADHASSAKIGRFLTDLQQKLDHGSDADLSALFDGAGQYGDLFKDGGALKGSDLNSLYQAIVRAKDDKTTAGGDKMAAAYRQSLKDAVKLLTLDGPQGDWLSEQRLTPRFTDYNAAVFAYLKQHQNPDGDFDPAFEADLRRSLGNDGWLAFRDRAKQFVAGVETNLARIPPPGLSDAEGVRGQVSLALDAHELAKDLPALKLLREVNDSEAGFQREIAGLRPEVIAKLDRKIAVEEGLRRRILEFSKLDEAITQSAGDPSPPIPIATLLAQRALIARELSKIDPTLNWSSGAAALADIDHKLEKDRAERQRKQDARALLASVVAPKAGVDAAEASLDQVIARSGKAGEVQLGRQAYQYWQGVTAQLAASGAPRDQVEEARKNLDQWWHQARDLVLTDIRGALYDPPTSVALEALQTKRNLDATDLEKALNDDKAGIVDPNWLSLGYLRRVKELLAQGDHASTSGWRGTWEAGLVERWEGRYRPALLKAQSDLEKLASQQTNDKVQGYIALLRDGATLSDPAKTLAAFRALDDLALASGQSAPFDVLDDAWIKAATADRSRIGALAEEYRQSQRDHLLFTTLEEDEYFLRHRLQAPLAAALARPSSDASPAALNELQSLDNALARRQSAEFSWTQLRERLDQGHQGLGGREQAAVTMIDSAAAGLKTDLLAAGQAGSLPQIRLFDDAAKRFRDDEPELAGLVDDPRIVSLKRVNAASLPDAYHVKESQVGLREPWADRTGTLLITDQALAFTTSDGRHKIVKQGSMTGDFDVAIDKNDPTRTILVDHDTQKRYRRNSAGALVEIDPDKRVSLQRVYRFSESDAAHPGDALEETVSGSYAADTGYRLALVDGGAVRQLSRRESWTNENGVAQSVSTDFMRHDQFYDRGDGTAISYRLNKENTDRAETLDRTEFNKDASGNLRETLRFHVEKDPNGDPAEQPRYFAVQEIRDGSGLDIWHKQRLAAGVVVPSEDGGTRYLAVPRSRSDWLVDPNAGGGQLVYTDDWYSASLPPGMSEDGPARQRVIAAINQRLNAVAAMGLDHSDPSRPADGGQTTLAGLQQAFSQQSDLTDVVLNVSGNHIGVTYFDYQSDGHGGRAAGEPRSRAESMVYQAIKNGDGYSFGLIFFDQDRNVKGGLMETPQGLQRWDPKVGETRNTAYDGVLPFLKAVVNGRSYKQEISLVGPDGQKLVLEDRDVTPSRINQFTGNYVDNFFTSFAAYGVLGTLGGGPLADTLSLATEVGLEKLGVPHEYAVYAGAAVGIAADLYFGSKIFGAAFDGVGELLKGYERATNFFQTGRVLFDTGMGIQSVHGLGESLEQLTVAIERHDNDAAAQALRGGLGGLLGLTLMLRSHEPGGAEHETRGSNENGSASETSHGGNETRTEQRSNPSSESGGARESSRERNEQRGQPAGNNEGSNSRRTSSEHENGGAARSERPSGDSTPLRRETPSPGSAPEVRPRETPSAPIKAPSLLQRVRGLFGGGSNIDAPAAASMPANAGDGAGGLPSREGNAFFGLGKRPGGGTRVEPPAAHPATSAGAAAPEPPAAGGPTPKTASTKGAASVEPPSSGQSAAGRNAEPTTQTSAEQVAMTGNPAAPETAAPGERVHEPARRLSEEKQDVSGQAKKDTSGVKTQSSPLEERSEETQTAAKDATKKAPPQDRTPGKDTSLAELGTSPAKDAPPRSAAPEDAPATIPSSQSHPPASNETPQARPARSDPAARSEGTSSQNEAPRPGAVQRARKAAAAFEKRSFDRAVGGAGSLLKKVLPSFVVKAADRAFSGVEQGVLAVFDPIGRAAHDHADALLRDNPTFLDRLEANLIRNAFGGFRRSPTTAANLQERLNPDLRDRALVRGVLAEPETAARLKRGEPVTVHLSFDPQTGALRDASATPLAGSGSLELKLGPTGLEIENFRPPTAPMSDYAFEHYQKQLVDTVGHTRLVAAALDRSDAQFNSAADREVAQKRAARVEAVRALSDAVENVGRRPLEERAAKAETELAQAQKALAAGEPQVAAARAEIETIRKLERAERALDDANAELTQAKKTLRADDPKVDGLVDAVVERWQEFEAVRKAAFDASRASRNAGVGQGLFEAVAEHARAVELRDAARAEGKARTEALARAAEFDGLEFEQLGLARQVGARGERAIDDYRRLADEGQLTLGKELEHQGKTAEGKDRAYCVLANVAEPMGVKIADIEAAIDEIKGPEDGPALRKLIAQRGMLPGEMSELIPKLAAHFGFEPRRIQRGSVFSEVAKGSTVGVILNDGGPAGAHMVNISNLRIMRDPVTGRSEAYVDVADTAHRIPQADGSFKSRVAAWRVADLVPMMRGRFVGEGTVSGVVIERAGSRPARPTVERPARPLAEPLPVGVGAAEPGGPRAEQAFLRSLAKATGESVDALREAGATKETFDKELAARRGNGEKYEDPVAAAQRAYAGKLLGRPTAAEKALAEAASTAKGPLEPIKVKPGPYFDGTAESAAPRVDAMRELVADYLRERLFKGDPAGLKAALERLDAAQWTIDGKRSGKDPRRADNMGRELILSGEVFKRANTADVAGTYLHEFIHTLAGGGELAPHVVQADFYDYMNERLAARGLDRNLAPRGTLGERAAKALRGFADAMFKGDTFDADYTSDVARVAKNARGGSLERYIEKTYKDRNDPLIVGKRSPAEVKETAEAARRRGNAGEAFQAEVLYKALRLYETKSGLKLDPAGDARLAKRGPPSSERGVGAAELPAEPPARPALGDYERLADADDMPGLAKKLGSVHPDDLYRGLALDDAAARKVLENLRAGRGLPALEEYSLERLGDWAAKVALNGGEPAVETLLGRELTASDRAAMDDPAKYRELVRETLKRRAEHDPHLRDKLFQLGSSAYLDGDIPPFLQSTGLGGKDGTGAGSALYFAVEKGLKQGKNAFVFELDPAALEGRTVPVERNGAAAYADGTVERVLFGGVPQEAIKSVWINGESFSPRAGEVGVGAAETPRSAFRDAREVVDLPESILTIKGLKRLDRRGKALEISHAQLLEAFKDEPRALEGFATVDGAVIKVGGKKGEAEIQASAAAVPHPDNVKIPGVIAEGPFPGEDNLRIVVMEKAQGAGLDEYLAKKRALDRPISLADWNDFESFVRELNARGVRHGDFTNPENVHVWSDPSTGRTDFEIIDFGEGKLDRGGARVAGDDAGVAKLKAELEAAGLLESGGQGQVGVGAVERLPGTKIEFRTDFERSMSDDQVLATLVSSGRTGDPRHADERHRYMGGADPRDLAQRQFVDNRLGGWRVQTENALSNAIERLNRLTAEGRRTDAAELRQHVKELQRLKSLEAAPGDLASVFSDEKAMADSVREAWRRLRPQLAKNPKFRADFERMLAGRNGENPAFSFEMDRPIGAGIGMIRPESPRGIKSVQPIQEVTVTGLTEVRAVFALFEGRVRLLTIFPEIGGEAGVGAAEPARAEPAAATSAPGLLERVEAAAEALYDSVVRRTGSQPSPESRAAATASAMSEMSRQMESSLAERSIRAKERLSREAASGKPVTTDVLMVGGGIHTAGFVSGLEASGGGGARVLVAEQGDTVSAVFGVLGRANAHTFDPKTFVAGVNPDFAMYGEGPRAGLELLARASRPGQEYADASLYALQATAQLYASNAEVAMRTRVENYEVYDPKVHGDDWGADPVQYPVRARLVDVADAQAMPLTIYSKKIVVATGAGASPRIPFGTWEVEGGTARATPPPRETSALINDALKAQLRGSNDGPGGVPLFQDVVVAIDRLARTQERHGGRAAGYEGKTVAVVGGGLSGWLFVERAAKAAGGPKKIVWFDIGTFDAATTAKVAALERDYPGVKIDLREKTSVPDVQKIAGGKLALQQQALESVRVGDRTRVTSATPVDPSRTIEVDHVVLAAGGAHKDLLLGADKLLGKGLAYSNVEGYAAAVNGQTTIARQLVRTDKAGLASEPLPVFSIGHGANLIPETLMANDVRIGADGREQIVRQRSGPLSTPIEREMSSNRGPDAIATMEYRTRALAQAFARELETSSASRAPTHGAERTVTVSDAGAAPLSAELHPALLAMRTEADLLRALDGVSLDARSEVTLRVRGGEGPLELGVRGLDGPAVERLKAALDNQAAAASLRALAEQNGGEVHVHFDTLPGGALDRGSIDFTTSLSETVRRLKSELAGADDPKKLDELTYSLSRAQFSDVPSERLAQIKELYQKTFKAKDIRVEEEGAAAPGALALKPGYKSVSGAVYYKIVRNGKVEATFTLFPEGAAGKRTALNYLLGNKLLAEAGLPVLDIVDARRAVYATDYDTSRIATLAKAAGGEPLNARLAERGWRDDLGRAVDTLARLHEAGRPVRDRAVERLRNAHKPGLDGLGDEWVVSAHGDYSADNVFLTPDGNVVLTGYYHVPEGVVEGRAGLEGLGHAGQDLARLILDAEKFSGASRAEAEELVLRRYAAERRLDAEAFVAQARRALPEWYDWWLENQAPGSAAQIAQRRFDLPTAGKERMDAKLRAAAGVGAAEFAVERLPAPENRPDAQARRVKLGDGRYVMELYDGWFYPREFSRGGERPRRYDRRGAGEIKLHVAVESAADLLKLQEALLPSLFADPDVNDFKTMDPLKGLGQAGDGAGPTGRGQGAKGFTIYPKTPEGAFRVRERLARIIREKGLALEKPIDSGNVDEVDATNRVGIVRDRFSAGFTEEGGHAFVLDPAIERPLVAEFRAKLEAPSSQPRFAPEQLRAIEKELGLREGQLQYGRERAGAPDGENARLVLRNNDYYDYAPDYANEHKAGKRTGDLTDRPALYELARRYGIDPVDFKPVSDKAPIAVDEVGSAKTGVLARMEAALRAAEAEPPKIDEFRLGRADPGARTPALSASRRIAIRAGEHVLSAVFEPSGPAGPGVYVREGRGPARKLEAGKELKVGRAPSNDIVLTDPTTSREHVALSLDDGKIVVRDLGSRSGVVVRQEAARGFDERLGLGGQRKTPPLSLERPILIDAGPRQLRVFFDDEGAQGAGVYVEDPATGERSRRLQPGEAFKVGRDPSSDFQVRDPNVSRRHLLITIEDGRVVVEDLGSTQGTRARAQDVEPEPARVDGSTLFSIAERAVFMAGYLGMVKVVAKAMGVEPFGDRAYWTREFRKLFPVDPGELLALAVKRRAEEGPLVEAARAKAEAEQAALGDEPARKMFELIYDERRFPVTMSDGRIRTKADVIAELRENLIESAGARAAKEARLVVGAFDDVRVRQVQGKEGDCAIRTIYNLPESEAIRAVFPRYEDFRDLFERMANRVPRDTKDALSRRGTPHDVAREIVEQLGFRMNRGDYGLTESELLDRLQWSNGNVYASIVWRPPWEPGWSSHAVVISGAVKTRGVWKFVVLDPHMATPRLYTHADLARLGVHVTGITPRFGNAQIAATLEGLKIEYARDKVHGPLTYARDTLFRRVLRFFGRAPVGADGAPAPGPVPRDIKRLVLGSGRSPGYGEVAPKPNDVTVDINAWSTAVRVDGQGFEGNWPRTFHDGSQIPDAFTYRTREGIFRAFYATPDGRLVDEGTEGAALYRQQQVAPDLVGDLNRLPFVSGAFEEVLFENMPFDAFTGPNHGGIGECARLLKPGGRMIIKTGGLAPADEVLAAVKAAGMTVKSVDRRRGLVVKAVKP